MPNLMRTLEVQGMLPKVAASPGVREHFENLPSGGMKCRLCGAKVDHPRAAAAHLADKHPGKIEAREFSEGKRESLAKKGQAMPHGGYPIVTRADLENAVKAFGRAKNPEATKRHIIKRARALGATDLLPEDWKGA